MFTASSQVPAAERPLLLVDVDGVISLFGFPAGSPSSGLVPALVDGLPHLLSHQTARRLESLADRFEMAWCSGWEERADEHLPHLLGLPRGWPHVPLSPTGRRTSVAGHWKLAPIDAFAGRDRPLAWIDDALDDACEAWAAARPGPTLLIRTHPAVGLSAADAQRLAEWAAAPRRPHWKR